MNATNHTLTPIYPAVENVSSATEYPPGNPSQEEVWKWLKNGTAILWTHTGISVGIVVGEKAKWKSGEEWANLDWANHLVELRAFNPDREWRIWRSRTGLRSRIRIDAASNGKPVQALDTQVNLRGVVGEHLQSGKETLLLRTRNYLGVDKVVGISRYEDVRYLEVLTWTKGGTK